MARLHFIAAQIREIEDARQERLEGQGEQGPNAMVRLPAQMVGIGIETADMLVHEVFSRNLRDRRAVARYAGLTGTPDESGARRREKGLAKAGNARVRRGMVQLAWRFLLHQRDSALARWYRARTADARAGTRKTLIVALARKLLVGLWQLATMGKVPEGYYSVQIMLGKVARKGEIGLCGTCMDARGLRDDELIEGAKRGTLVQLADWTAEADKVLVF